MLIVRQQWPATKVVINLTTNNSLHYFGSNAREWNGSVVCYSTGNTFLKYLAKWLATALYTVHVRAWAYLLVNVNVVLNFYQFSFLQYSFRFNISGGIDVVEKLKHIKWNNLLKLLSVIYWVVVLVILCTIDRIDYVINVILYMLYK